mgnify:CR=1 FL=1
MTNLIKLLSLIFGHKAQYLSVSSTDIILVRVHPYTHEKDMDEFRKFLDKKLGGLRFVVYRASEEDVELKVIKAVPNDTTSTT